MSAANTATVRREIRRAKTSEELSRILSEHGASNAQIAALLGVRSVSDVQKWRDPDHNEKCISLADALGLPEIVRLALAAFLAGDGHVVSAVSSAPTEAGDIKLLLASQREHSEALQRFAEAIEDGVIDAQEAEAIERECTESIRALAAIRERARMAVTARGLVVRGSA